MRSRSIDTINILQHKNLINSLNTLITEKSKKIVHYEKDECAYSTEIYQSASNKT